MGPGAKNVMGPLHLNYIIIDTTDHELITYCLITTIVFPTLYRNHCVLPINQLLCAFRFYAPYGCFQGTAGDLCGVSTATVNRIVHKVSRAIASLRRDYIFFPERKLNFQESSVL